MVCNGNQITKIKVMGFKSIREAEINLGMLNVLIGANGAGKSNFVSIFKILRGMNAHKIQSYIAQQGGSERILYMGSKTTTEAVIQLYSKDVERKAILFPTNGIGMSAVELLPETDECFQWGVYHFHDTSDTAHMKKPCGLNDNIEFASDGRNLAAYLYRLREKERPSYQRIVRAIRQVAPFFDDFVLRPNPLNEDMIQLEWTRIDSDIPFLATQISDGTLRFICLATLLMQPSHLAPETIVIDEPELGLHPYAIALLGAMAKSASVDKQLVLSTQSVDLLNEFDAEDIIVVDHINNASSFRRLPAEELKIWLEDDYSLGELWCKNILGGRPS